MNRGNRSLVTSWLLVALLCAPAASAGQSVEPAERLTVGATSASWDELVALQRSLRERRASAAVASPYLALETPLVEVAALGPADSSGGAERGFPTCQTCPTFGCEPSLAAGFDSQLDVPDGAGVVFIPPDVAGAVGPVHLLTMLHNKVLIQDRNGATVSSVDTSVFWSPLGTTPLSPTTSNPRVYYDAGAGRFLATIRNGSAPAGATSIYFAISQTSDATATWDFYSFPADPTASSFADWLALGYNPLWITITANMFAAPAGAFLGAKMWTIDKATALVPGGPLTVSVFPTGFMTTAHGVAGASSVHPARTLDNNNALWMVNDSFTSGGVFLLQLTALTGTGPAPTVSGLAGSPFGGTSSLCFTTTNWSGTQLQLTQAGEARPVSSFSTRVASVVVRCGKIWVANSGGLPGPSTNAAPTSTAVLWREMNPSLPFPAAPGAPGTMVLQDGAITTGASTACAYPSLAVNCAEDVLVGFANADATRFLRGCYAMRLASDPPGFMGAARELKAGESTYWKNFGVGAVAAWGRYTSTAVDPLDDRTMWTLQEYADTRADPSDDGSRWGTHWGRVGEVCCASDELDDWTIDITVDNQYAIYFGDGTSTDTLVGTDVTWPTTESWVALDRLSSDYVYVATASDQSQAQGFLAAFTNTTLGTTVLTNPADWEVFPAGRYAATNPFFPGPWTASLMPTQAQVDTAIAFATANQLWVAPSTAPGYTNGVAPWGVRPGIPAAAQWIWFESGLVPSGTILTPFRGGNHDEFLVFRVRGTQCPCATEDDWAEENDSCAAPASLPPFTSWVGLSVSRTDPDWYRMRVGGKRRLLVQADFLHVNGDVDLRLYSACNGTLLASSTSLDDDEFLSWTNNSIFPRTVFLEVSISASSAGACNDYGFSWGTFKRFRFQ